MRRIAVALLLAVAVTAGVAVSTVASPAGAQTTTTTADPGTTTTTAEPATTTPPDTTPPTTAPPLFPSAPSITAEQFAAFLRALFPPPPAGSGAGRRIVYSIGQQRVWLMGDGERVEKTYLVSGRTGLPALGTYHVYSKSRWANSGSVRMQYMIRFARGRSLAIGFHSIPQRGNGSLLQTLWELGTPRSHGCVRQKLSDAAELWDWAPVGTTVVVTR